jgi:uroporphyrin-III C-methyltransferase/precorrin-2 dehydrogenase/sirohydrochlorin ferrochelatase
MNLLPIFLKFAGRRCLVVGAGEVAREKIDTLLRAELELHVVAPFPHLDVRKWAAAGMLTWSEREFQPSDLDGNQLVIAATNLPAVNAAVYRAAVERGILANSVDDVPNCDFFFGSVVHRGTLQIAISTGGKSPALAQKLRREIDEQLPQDLGPWLEHLGQLRREILEAHPRGDERKMLLHKLVQRQICESAHCPTRQLVQTILAEEAENFDESYPVQQYAKVLPAREDGCEAETVHLVGAGPGDPDLLTVKALRLIQTADVILHDDLVTPAILDLASPSAQILNVGKRCGEKTISQDQINALMIGNARNGHCVVRLKGGDPLLFGRAAEELAALAAAGIQTQIVSGITAASAAAAALGCSLTDRGSASSVIFSTGHRAHHSSEAPIPHTTSTGEKNHATRVVYMPGRNLSELAAEWLADGLSADLPCAVVSHAALPGQRVLRTTLGQLSSLETVAAPSLLIAGWTVARL